MQIIRKLNKAGRYAKSYLQRGGLILLYHRVDTPECDPFELCVTPRIFEEQLKILKEQTNPMPLREFARAAIEKKLPPKSVAITFDDGYLDNLKFAKPLLEKHEIPATIFIATGNLGKTFWWDKLTTCILSGYPLPSEIDLVNNNHAFKRENLKDDQESRKKLFRDLYQFFQPLPLKDQEVLLEKLAEAVGRDFSLENLPRSMVAPEIIELADSNVIDIGAHTVSHPRLSAHSREFQKYEIFESKKFLSDLLGSSINTFSYPYGTLKEYNEMTVSLAREAGLEFACSVKSDLVYPQSDPFQLPRFDAFNWEKARFQKFLKAWLHN